MKIRPIEVKGKCFKKTCSQSIIESSDASDKFLYISVHFFSYKHFKHFKPYKLQSSTSIFDLTLRESSYTKAHQNI